MDVSTMDFTLCNWSKMYNIYSNLQPNVFIQRRRRKSKERETANKMDGGKALLIELLLLMTLMR